MVGHQNVGRDSDWHHDAQWHRRGEYDVRDCAPERRLERGCVRRREENDYARAGALHVIGLAGTGGLYGAQDTVEAVLNSPTFMDGDVGSFNYLCSGSILSYVIFQQTGKTPLAYAREVLFPTLGINDDVVWTPTHGSDGIHESGHGMVLGWTSQSSVSYICRAASPAVPRARSSFPPIS